MSDEGIQDAALDAATNKILGMLGGAGTNAFAEQAPRNQNQIGRDAINRERSGDMDDDDDVALSPDEQKQMDPRAARNGQQQPDNKADEPQDKQAATEEDAGDWLEIPAEAEGQEAVRVPLAEAVEAVKQVRAMQGDIAAAVHKAEDEARARQSEYLRDIVQSHAAVRHAAEMALQVIPQPQPPSRLYLDPNSQYYNPEVYHREMLAYEDQVRAWRSIEAKATEARSYEQQALLAASEAAATREHERLSRYVPDWGDEGKRQAMITDISEKLGKLYGISPDYIASVPFNHGLVRMAMDAIAAKTTPAPKPAEVKKAVQERVAKVTRGNAQQARNADGTFQAGQASQARQALRSSGDERDAARLFMTDPTLRQLLK